MIRQVCYVCGIELGQPLELNVPGEHISHGVCRKCLDICMAGAGKGMQEFLDSLQAPVIVVDDNVRVLTANAIAQKLVSKSMKAIGGRLAGEVFECTHAHQPGGCGHTIHCQSCMIRISVTKTFQTGDPCIRVPACQDLDTFEGPRKVRYLITTEKVSGAVLLRIDDFQPNIPAVA
jgi:hypothetical protein